MFVLDKKWWSACW